MIPDNRDRADCNDGSDDRLDYTASARRFETQRNPGLKSSSLRFETFGDRLVAIGDLARRAWPSGASRGPRGATVKGAGGETPAFIWEREALVGRG